MPEISEAQSAVNQLNVALHGATIIGVSVIPWYEKGRDASGLRSMVGWTFSGVSRRGKAILFEFSNAAFVGGAPVVGDWFLLSRLGMTGHWLLNPPAVPTATPVVAFDLSSPQGVERLLYMDTRHFGTLELARSTREFEAIRTLGPDLLSDQFSAEWVLACAGRHSAPMKALLTRPEYFPGVGNWVANEALFRAAVAPLAPSRALTPPQAERLASALILTVRNGIAKGGATLKDWRNPDGSLGRAQEDFAVYGRGGKPCLVCRTKIDKTSVDGRPTFYCSKCQSGVQAEPVSEAFVQEVLKATGEA